MNTRLALVLILGFFLFGPLSGCRRTEPAAAVSAMSAQPNVLVVNYPLYYFATRLAGNSFTVEFPMKENGDPAFWQPDVATLLAYQKADLILLNGAGFDAWTEKVSLPDNKTVDTGAAFKGELLDSGEAVTHSHGLQGAHTHPKIAFTTWLDPRLAMLQADAIAHALIRLRPADAVAINGRLAALKADWAAWARDFEAVVAGKQQQEVIASHPVYQYLQRAGGLNWPSVHWEPDEIPTEEQWRAFSALAKAHPARWMVWESAPLPDVKAKLAKEFGITCVVFDPTSNRPTQGDLLTAMRANLEGLSRVYGTPPAP